MESVEKKKDDIFCGECSRKNYQFQKGFRKFKAKITVGDKNIVCALPEDFVRKMISEKNKELHVVEKIEITHREDDPLLRSLRNVFFQSSDQAPLRLKLVKFCKKKPKKGYEDA